MWILLACGSPAPQPGGSANYSASLGESPDFSDATARLVATTWLEYGENQLSGFFADGPQPSLHTEAERTGSCRLLRYTPSTCDPACTGGDTCIDGACVSWPEREDHGPITWTWPDGTATVPPDDLLGYFATGTTGTAGDTSITYEDTTLEAPTIGPPLADGDWASALTNRSGDATLRWSSPILHARVRLHMTDCTGSHGGIAKAELECEGPDTGSLVVAGAFLDELEAGDWSLGECGSHRFERYHAAAPTDDDRVRYETVGPGGLFWRPD